MKRVFADAFFFFALLSERDRAHADAVAFLAKLQGELLTTEWVLIEVADGISSEASRASFVTFHETVRNDPSIQIVPASAQSFAEGLDLYSSRLDKDWSLTDCISFVLMEREGISDALTADRHFRQAGFRTLFG
jgi:uncharacterized protein